MSILRRHLTVAHKLSFPALCAAGAILLTLASAASASGSAKASEYVAVTATSSGTLTPHVGDEEVGQLTSTSLSPTSLENTSAQLPVNTSPPTITGAPKEGKLLRAKAGSWSGERLSYEYQWERCNNLGEECLPVPDTNARIYSVGVADVGYTLRVTVTAKGAVEPTVSATSTVTAVVLGQPVNTALPTITGEAVQGETLSATEGSWTGEPSEYAYEWSSCNGQGECTEASGKTYQLHEADVSDTVKVTVTASSVLGATQATFAATRPVGGAAAVAWGKNYPAAQLGAGYHDNYQVSPVSVRGLSDVAAVMAAGDASYALLGDGTVRSWGEDFKGALGDGKSRHRSSGSPVAVVEKTNGELREMTGVTAIAAADGSGTHAMALVNDSEHEGEVMTWGASEYGEHGDGEYMYGREWLDTRKGEQPQPLEDAIGIGLKHVVGIAAGGDSDFALQKVGGETKLWAWGGNRNGKLGTGEESHTICQADDGVRPYPCSPAPEQVDLGQLGLRSGVKVTAIAAGRHAAYAVLSDGRVVAWGENNNGELGDGTTEDSDVPKYVCAVGNKEGACSNEREYLEGVTAVSGGEQFALALLKDGKVVGWGADRSGQLGGHSSGACRSKTKTECQRAPKVVRGLERVTAISAGGDFSLALNSNGEVYSFGNNERGQLGDGRGEGEGPEECTRNKEKSPCSREPSAIKGLSDVGGISAGGGFGAISAGAGSEGHSLAYLKSGSGPPPLLSVTPQVNSLEVAWRDISPKSEYKIKWKEKAPSETEIEELQAEAQKDEEIAGEARVEAEEAEENGEKAEAARFEAEETEVKAEAEKFNKKVRELEQKAEEGYPQSKEIHITAACDGRAEEWCHTITEMPIGKEGSEPLTSEASPQITLKSIGVSNGDGVMRITGTPLP